MRSDLYGFHEARVIVSRRGSSPAIKFDEEAFDFDVKEDAIARHVRRKNGWVRECRSKYGATVGWA